MAQFAVNPHRFDPYKQFKFRVKWDGRVVAGISRVSALRRATEVVTQRDGGEPSRARQSPGQTVFDPIHLERGLTHDREFEDWANKVWNIDNPVGKEVSLKDFRKDIVIELLNEAGQVVMAYMIYRCWPSEYVALGELDASGSAVAIERLVLQHEGWTRDQAVTEPVEASFGQVSKMSGAPPEVLSSTVEKPATGTAGEQAKKKSKQPGPRRLKPDT